MADDLLGVSEIAERLRVTPRTAARYVKRPDFPEPLRRLAAGPVWSAPDVDVWARETLPLKVGRPRKPAANDGERGLRPSAADTRGNESFTDPGRPPSA
jgi:hypothetical protein